MLLYFLGHFEYYNFHVENDLDTFWTILGNFLFLHLVTLVESLFWGKKPFNVCSENVERERLRRKRKRTKKWKMTKVKM